MISIIPKFKNIQQHNKIIYIKQKHSKMSNNPTALEKVMSQTTKESQQNILALMKESRIYWHARRQIINTYLKNRENGVELTIEEVMKLLQSTENQEKIVGLINNCLQKSTKRLPIERDPNPDIEAYRLKWSDLIVKEFNTIAYKRTREEQEYNEEDQSVSYIYDCSSMLEFLTSLKINKTGIKIRDSPIFLFPQETLKAPKFQQIRSKFSFLLFQQNMIGGDMDTDLREREKKAKKIADGQNISNEVEQYLCFGCVSGERINVYKRYFECFYEYTGKRVDYSLYERMWKGLIYSDMIDIMNNQKYFVFKEQIKKMYKIFICDRQLSQMVKIKPIAASQAQKLDKFAPIHNILPCKSFSVYMAPFCYSSTDVEDIYDVFQQIYANYFITLHTISSLPDSVLSLCILFEELLYQTEKKIVHKLQQLHIQPLRLVFPWIFYCFIPYIQVQQFYLLLDRIIGNKGLEILPLYCVSIFFKQKTAILGAKNQAQVQQILQDSLRDDIFIETIRQYFKYHI